MVWMAKSAFRRRNVCLRPRARIVATFLLGAILAFAAVPPSTVATGSRFASSETSGSGDAWGRLERPLHIPTLTAGAHCPRSHGGSAAPRVGFTLGTGPAYPVFGTSAPGGIVSLGGDLRRSGWYLHKTIWAVSGRYRGPVLVRARRVDGPSPVRFGFDRHLFVPRDELRISPATRRSWRLIGSYTFLQGPGCYAFQADGLTFSKVVVFEVQKG